MEGFDASEVGQNYPKDFAIDVKGILSKVNLRDPPVMGLITLHLVLFGATLAVRRHRFWRAVIFAVSMAISLLAEKIGEIAAKNWEKLGFSDNYFDEYGVFLLFFVALPPVVNCILLFSQLAGDLGGRLIEKYLISPHLEDKKPKNEKDEAKEEEEDKDEKQKKD